MKNLKTVEIKAFVPTSDYTLSKQFYQDVGFTMRSDDGDIAYFHSGDCSFLLQNFYEPVHAQNFMMHVLVEDIHAWHTQIAQSGVSEKYKVLFTEVETQPWGMLDFVLKDPTGVLWRFGQNL
jgi:uncharacterized glyoxalase superfamily protein PhnB